MPLVQTLFPTGEIDDSPTLQGFMTEGPFAQTLSFTLDVKPDDEYWQYSVTVYLLPLEITTMGTITRYLDITEGQRHHTTGGNWKLVTTRDRRHCYSYSYVHTGHGIRNTRKIPFKMIKGCDSYAIYLSFEALELRLEDDYYTTTLEAECRLYRNQLVRDRDIISLRTL